MSDQATDNVSNEDSGVAARRLAPDAVSKKIHQLLAAAGSGPKDDSSQIETVEHNWREPHYFSSEQLVELESFTERFAAAVAEKFTGFCQSQSDVTVVSTTQHFADEFASQTSDNEQKDYYLAFGDDQKHPYGLVGIPERTAVTWATQLLGDSEPEKDSGKELSQLERSLLLDLASAIAEVLSSSHTTCNFRPAGSIIQGQWPLELPGTEELCKISLDVKKADSENSSGAYILIPCAKLEPLLGKAAGAAESSSGDTSGTVLGHLERMPVTITAQLASTLLTFEEIMDLQVDDILLLDKRVDEQAELIVNGRTICYGWPAKSAGNYAIAVTATAFGNTAKRIRPPTGTK